jgi:very-short-patch-repair endonuclease
MEELRPDWQAEEDAPGDSPVLVAIVNNQRDFDIARREGWYRIPVKHAPRRLGAEYLAFYQTKVFGQEKWAVHYYAPIRRVHLMQRRDLLPQEGDHPRADDWYYKIEIGPLQRLPHPIPSRRLRRITFIPTTLSRLLSAWEVNDLWLGDEEEERLWEAFKQNEIEIERRVFLREEDEAYLIDFAATCRRGKVAILCGGAGPLGEGSALRERPAADYELTAAGWEVLRFSPRQIEGSLEDCLASIRQAIAQKGGLLDSATEPSTSPTED